MYYVYVIQALSNPAIFYTGCTHDLRQRFASHNAGKNKSTRMYQWKLVYYEAYLTLSAARKREYRLKHNGKAKFQLLKRIKESLKMI